VPLALGCVAVGQRIEQLGLDADGVEITAVLRAGERLLHPPPALELQCDDVVVLFGPPEALARVEAHLTQ